MKDFYKKLISFCSYPITNRIKKFKNCYRGESCYIISDGISLKWFDLKGFSDLVTIGVHKIGLHKQFDQLHVEHMLMIDPWVFYPLIIDYLPKGKILYNPIQKLYREVIKQNPQINFYTLVTNYPALPSFHSNMYYIFHKLPGTFDNKLKHFHYFDGSFKTAITIAIYMGFHKIYLVGFDYTHNPARVGHWFEKGRGIIGNNKYNDYEKDFIQIAREYVDIITVTLDGSSKHLEYITYKDLTGLEPVFKENIQLVKNNKYLKALSSYRHGFGYKIFGTKSHGTHLL